MEKTIEERRQAKHDAALAEQVRQHDEFVRAKVLEIAARCYPDPVGGVVGLYDAADRLLAYVRGQGK